MCRARVAGGNDHRFAGNDPVASWRDARTSRLRGDSILKGLCNAAQGRPVVGKRGDGPTLGNRVKRSPTLKAVASYRPTLFPTSGDEVAINNPQADRCNGVRLSAEARSRSCLEPGSLGDWLLIFYLSTANPSCDKANKSKHEVYNRSPSSPRQNQIHHKLKNKEAAKKQCCIALPSDALPLATLISLSYLRQYHLVALGLSFLIN